MSNVADSGQSVEQYPDQSLGIDYNTDAVIGTVNQMITPVQIGPGKVCFNSGTGAPAIAGNKGDVYFRYDTPTTTNQRLYICTVAGAAGVATWVGVV